MKTQRRKGKGPLTNALDKPICEKSVLGAGYEARTRYLHLGNDENHVLTNDNKCFQSLFSPQKTAC